MKNLILISGLLMAAFLFGCSSDNPTIPTTADDALVDGSIYQRPEFIDDRPLAVQEQFTLTADDVFTVAPTAEKAGGKYALVIGISDYAGTANDLTYCDDDAIDWRNYLQGQGYTVTTLLDGAATAAAIQSAVGNLASLSIAGNEIAFAYSGHGSRGNMISADLYYVSSSWFGGMFAGVGSTKMAFNFDACQIGAFGTALNAAGRVIALASDTRRYSYDGTAAMANGVFTYYQMLGFDQQGYVFAEDDDAYACQQMILWAKSVRVKVAPSYVDTYVGSLDY
ncbi:MAG: caspase family protein [bacterium]|nr:caspase family protein [bacterium]